MQFHKKDHNSTAYYFLMLQALVPRPIAWVLSENKNGSFNVAPFSFFNGVAAEPPLIMIAVARNNDGSRKDTCVNIDERNHFVVHVPPGEMAEAMVATSKHLPVNESEIGLANLTTVPVEGESLPRIEGPKLAMFVRKHSIIEVGDEKVCLVLGEITNIWVDDSAVIKKGSRSLIDVRKLNPVSRLGGTQYALLGDIKEIDRPK